MKHLENFKSETIQSIYDFLEQDADVTNFKRDLIAVAEYKKTSLHDLEAELFQYHDLMKEDLSDKITFVFREDGYLGMFGECTNTLVERTDKAYKELKTGEKVTADIRHGKIKSVSGTIFVENRGHMIFMIQDECGGDEPMFSRLDVWKKYGTYSWALYSSNGILSDHSDLRRGVIEIDNLIYGEEGIKELKNNMHFALVI